jgi:cation transport ATPase
MDVLIALGTSCSWLYGFVRLFLGYTQAQIDDTEMYSMKILEHAHYFEISSALLTIILIGKYLE